MGSSIFNNNLFNAINGEGKFDYSDRVFILKYIKQFFIVLLTNLSSFILITIDGFVVSRFVGIDALNSVNLLHPLALIIGATTGLLAGGVNIILSKTYGLGSKTAITKLFRAIILLTIIFFVGTAIIQIPMEYLMINSYSVSANIKRMIGLYAIGLIIANSVAVINTVGTYMLIAAGQVKVLLKLAILESSMNIIFDLLFVGLCNMGVLGAGFGTAVSCVIRAVATIVLVQKSLKLFPIEKVDCKDEMRNIILNGLPNMSNMLLVSISSYIMNAVIAKYVGIDAISVISVCTVGISLFTMVSNSFVQTGNSLIGILVGSEDWKVAKDLEISILKISITTITVLVGLGILFPQTLFAFYGVNHYTNFQLISVRLYLLKCIPFAIIACLTSFCLYCEKRSVTIVRNVIEVILLFPTFFILKFIDVNLVFLCYFICGMVSVVILAIVYHITIHKKVREGEKSRIIYFCFKSDEAISISQKTSDFLTKNNTDKKIVYKLALVFEEIGAYAKSNNSTVNVFMSIRENNNSIRIFYLDDGEPAIMNKKLIGTDLILGNYNLIESLASSFVYQNVGGMNNFIMTFDCA